MNGDAVLLVDLGNTRLKWALMGGSVCGPSSVVAHAEVGVATAVRRAWERLPPPARVLVGSVAGVECNDELRALCRQLWGGEPRFVCARERAAGVTNGYDSPARLGVDRWLALLAVHADRRGAACILDCGTAVTIDVIDGGGRHLGGLILPGLRLMRECLLSRTQIPQVAVPPARAELGRDTGSAIANGALLAVSGAVRETLAHAGQVLGVSPRLVIAGGDAPTLAAVLGGHAEVRPDLVLEGLAVLASSDAIWT